MTTAKRTETNQNQRERNSAAFAAWFNSKMDEYYKRDELRESQSKAEAQSTLHREGK